MTGLRKALIGSVPALFGLLVIMIMGMILQSSVYHTSLTKYGVPICSMDRHQFEGETCEACGKDIESTGVFYSVAMATDNPYGQNYELPFADFYESYEAFKIDYNECLFHSGVVMIVVLAEICVYVFLLMRSRNKHQQGGRLK